MTDAQRPRAATPRHLSRVRPRPRLRPGPARLRAAFERVRLGVKVQRRTHVRLGTSYASRRGRPRGRLRPVGAGCPPAIPWRGRVAAFERFLHFALDAPVDKVYVRYARSGPGAAHRRPRHAAGKAERTRPCSEPRRVWSGPSRPTAGDDADSSLDLLRRSVYVRYTGGRRAPLAHSAEWPQRRNVRATRKQEEPANRGGT
jgi:hypothetical protein